MTDYKLVPIDPAPEMVEAAEDAYMPFGDMEMAIRMALLAAPAVQGEPVGWQFYQDGKWWNGDDRIKDHRKNTEEAGYPIREVYAAPQPVEQQPAPDVAGLVEALEQCITSMLDSGYRADAVVIRAARSALAAHIKGDVV